MRPLRIRLSRGNMYDKVGTIGPLRGACEHDCDYCYRKDLFWAKSVREKYTGPVCLDERVMQARWVKDPDVEVVFPGSMTDLFAKGVPSEIIQAILAHCRKFSFLYLFQTKNPWRLLEFAKQFPKQSILGTTIETNRPYYVSKAPTVYERAEGIRELRIIGFRIMVSIEPIMAFDQRDFVGMLRKICPEYISIGADSRKLEKDLETGQTMGKLAEPSGGDVHFLIPELQKFTEVRLKANLKRIYDKQYYTELYDWQKGQIDG